MNFKDIHMDALINRCFVESEIELSHICNIKCTEKKKKPKESKLPRFRKNIYAKEVINFVLRLIETGEKIKNQVIDKY